MKTTINSTKRSTRRYCPR